MERRPAADLVPRVDFIGRSAGGNCADVAGLGGHVLDALSDRASVFKALKRTSGVVIV